MRNALIVKKKVIILKIVAVLFQIKKTNRKVNKKSLKDLIKKNQAKTATKKLISNNNNFNIK